MPAIALSVEDRIRTNVGAYMLAQIGGIDRAGNITERGKPFNVKYIQQIMVPALHRVANHEIEALMFLMHPRSIKTFLGTKNFLAWCFGRYPERTNMALSYSDDFAHKFGRDILQRVTSPIHQAVFPNSRLMPKYQGQGFFQMIAGGQFYSAGFGGQITGIGVDGVLSTDDPLPNMEAAESEAYMSHLMETRRSTVVTRLEGASEVLCATRWSRHDFVGRLLDEEGEAHEGGRWTVLKLPAEAGDDDPLGREPGQFLWPERHGEKWYKRHKQKTKTWMALFQQDPQGNRGVMFKREWLQFYTTPAKPGKWPAYMLVDPAKSKTGDSDRTCILVLLATQEKRLVLADASLGRYDPDERAAEVVRLCRKWRPHRLLYEEYGMTHDTWYLNRAMEQAKIRIHAIPIGRKGKAVRHPKDTRIEGLIPDFREGRIWLPAKKVGDEVMPWMGVPVNLANEGEDPQFVDFCEYFIDKEYAVYAGEDSVEHDDALDCLSRIHEPEMNLTFPLAPMAMASQTDALRNRRYAGRGSWESVY